MAKERFKALKADDGEAYTKFIDTAKDPRVTPLLRLTESYLDSLDHAVVAQQNEYGHFGGPQDFNTEDGPASEATSGARVSKDEEDKTGDKKVDYYDIAHRISEKIAMVPLRSIKSRVYSR